MKKIAVIIFALMLMVSASAQNIIRSGAFDNVYVGLEGGATSSLVFDENYTGTIAPVAGFEIGKDITPVIGLSLEEFVGFNNGAIGTPIVTNSNLVGNVKFNLMNLFGGYKGQPRLCEVFLVPGIGWGHQFLLKDADASGVDVNYATYNTFAQINFNLGEKKAWGISVKPGVVWNAYNGDGMGFNTKNANLKATVGVFYRFNNKKTGSHNFAINPYSVTKGDYEAALAEIDHLKNREPEVREVVKTVVQEKIVEKRVDAVRPGDTYITFAIGQTKLTAVEQAKVINWLGQVSKDTKVEIVGSADSATGTAKRNQYLAEKRAATVKAILLDNGFADENVTTRTQFDYDKNAEASRSAVLRIVVL